jgi:hypothetical protein
MPVSQLDREGAKRGEGGEKLEERGRGGKEK